MTWCVKYVKTHQTSLTGRGDRVEHPPELPLIGGYLTAGESLSQALRGRKQVPTTSTSRLQAGETMKLPGNFANHSESTMVVLSFIHLNQETKKKMEQSDFLTF